MDFLNIRDEASGLVARRTSLLIKLHVDHRIEIQKIPQMTSISIPSKLCTMRALLLMIKAETISRNNVHSVITYVNVRWSREQGK